jgi:hypothetical protein
MVISFGVVTAILGGSDGAWVFLYMAFSCWPLAFWQHYLLDPRTKELLSQLRVLGTPVSIPAAVGTPSQFQEVLVGSCPLKAGQNWTVQLVWTDGGHLELDSGSPSPAEAVAKAEALAESMDLTVALPPELDLGAAA